MGDFSGKVGVERRDLVILEVVCVVCNNYSNTFEFLLSIRFVIRGFISIVLGLRGEIDNGL